mgnify:CR=1 FL=1
MLTPDESVDKAVGNVWNCMRRVQRGDGSPLSAFNPSLFRSVFEYS